MNYILSNQDTVLAQITQLESSITQTEVINTLDRQNVAEHGINSSQQLNTIKMVHLLTTSLTDSQLLFVHTLLCDLTFNN